MKLTCSKCDHISDQTINWFTGKHHEYVCGQCGVLLQGDFNATVSGNFINILGVDACQHRERRDESAHIFYITEASEKEQSSEKRAGRINVKKDRGGNDEIPVPKVSGNLRGPSARF
jgi:hypothetical protein